MVESHQPRCDPDTQEPKTHTDQHVHPEQSRNLLLRDRCMLNGCCREPEILKEVQNADDSHDHANQPEILGIQNSGQNHQRPHPQNKGDALCQ